MADIDVNRSLGVYKSMWQHTFFMVNTYDLLVHPYNHPASNLGHTLPVLQPYDERCFPGCLSRTFNNLDYISTAIGRAIRELNSTLGVPRKTIRILDKNTVTCECCKCTFSIDGYNAHIVDGYCGNKDGKDTGNFTRLMPSTFILTLHLQLIPFIQISPTYLKSRFALLWKTPGHQPPQSIWTSPSEPRSLSGTLA